MTRWAHVAIAVLAGVVAALHIGKVPPAIPLLRAEFSMSLVQAGWVMGLSSALGAVSGLMVGRLTDQLTHRWSMVLGLALALAGSLIGTASTSALWLMTSRVIESFGIIMTVVAGPALVAAVSDPGDRQVALGLWGLWLPVGVAAMMLVSPVLLPSWGWRSSWIAASLVSLVPMCALIVLRMPQNAAGLPPVALLVGLKLTATRATSWIIAGIFLTYSASFMAVFGFLPTLLTERMHVGLNAASVLTAFAVLANAVGNGLGGVLARLGASRWLLIALPCVLMAATSMLVFGDSYPLELRYAASVIYALAGGLLPATIMGALPVYASRRDLVGTFSGFVMQGSNIGQCFGPMLLALIVASHGWPAAPSYIAAMMGLGLLLALRLRHLENKTHATPGLSVEDVSCQPKGDSQDRRGLPSNG